MRILIGSLTYLVYLFLLLPSLVVIPMSFGSSRELEFPPRSFSLTLYRMYLEDPTWTSATWTSVQLAFFSMILAVALGVTAAYGVERGQFFGRRLTYVYFMSPMVVPSVAVALGMYLYFSMFGVAGTLPTLVLCHTVMTAPFVIVLTLSGLRHINPRLETAAMVMGASRFYAFRTVTLPLLRPSLIAAALFAFLISFDEVVVAWFMSRVDSVTLPVKMYSSIQWEISPVLAAVSTMLTILSFAVCVAYSLLQKPAGEKTE